MASVTLAALAILFMPSFISPKFFKIIWLSNRFNMSVPDKGYSSSVPDKGYSRNASCTLNQIPTFLIRKTLLGDVVVVIAW